MKKIIAVFSLTLFSTLVFATSFHVHEDVTRHDDCTICVAMSLLHTTLMQAAMLYDVVFHTINISYPEPCHIITLLAFPISGRGPPTL